MDRETIDFVSGGSPLLLSVNGKGNKPVKQAVHRVAILLHFIKQASTRSKTTTTHKQYQSAQGTFYLLLRYTAHSFWENVMVSTYSYILEYTGIYTQAPLVAIQVAVGAEDRAASHTVELYHSIIKAKNPSKADLTMKGTGMS